MKSPSDMLLDESMGTGGVESLQRLDALTRLLTFARNEANELEADVVAYCLEVALAAVADSLREHTSMYSANGNVRDRGDPVRH